MLDIISKTIGQPLRTLTSNVETFDQSVYDQMCDIPDAIVCAIIIAFVFISTYVFNYSFIK